MESKCEVVISKLSSDLLTLHNQYTDKGASHWLNALPIHEQGFTLTKQEFRDALRLLRQLEIPGSSQAQEFEHLRCVIRLVHLVRGKPWSTAC